MTILAPPDIRSFRSELDRLIATSRPQATSTDLTNLYRTATAVYAVSNYRATNVASVPMIVKDVKTDKPVPDDHPAMRPLRTGYYDYMQRSELTNFFWGYNLLYKRRNWFEKPLSLRWINPNLYNLDTNREGLRRFRIIHGGYNYERVTDDHYIYPRDAVYSHGVDFSDDFDGVSEAEVAFLSGGLTVEMSATVLSFFQNMAMPVGVVMPDKAASGAATTKMSENDQKSLTAFLRNTFKGARNFGRMFISKDRWEFIQLQAKFDDLAMPELIKNAREDIFLVSGVPMVLLISGASSYAEFEGARRAWLQNWLSPRMWWYAGIFTEQLIKEFGNLKVEPDLNAIPGLKEDAATRANVTNSQVQGGYITLADAQRANDLPVDDALEGFYLINGVLTHRSQLEAMQQRTAPIVISPNDGQPSGGEPTSPPQEPKLVDDQPHPLPPRPKSDGWVSDEVFTELRNWQSVYERKGAKRDFEFRHVRIDVEKRVKARLAEASTPEMLKAAFDYARAISAQKAIATTEAEFTRAFNNLLEGARNGDYTRQQFQSQLRKLLRQYGVMAYRDGLVDGGVIDGELDDEDRAEVATLLAQQSDYIGSFGSVLFNKDGISENLADLKAELWWNKSVIKFYQSGLASADRNGMYLWVIGATESHCVTCAALGANGGQIHRMKEYAKRGLLPKSSALACGGWLCDCRLVKTSERARGTFPRLLASASAHDHSHGEPADHIHAHEFEFWDEVDGMDDSHLLVTEGAPEKGKNDE